LQVEADPYLRLLIVVEPLSDVPNKALIVAIGVRRILYLDLLVIDLKLFNFI